MQGSTTPQIEIVDSIRVNYLGQLTIRDYSPEKNTFLAQDFSSETIIEFDGSGNILHSFVLQQDGPNRIESRNMGLNYFQDSLALILSQHKIVFFSRTGEVKGRIEIGENAFYINGIRGKGIFPLGNFIAYLRPEDFSHIEDYEALFKDVYSKPLLEIFDPVSGTKKQTMEFPKSSIYNIKGYRYWTFPVINNSGEDYHLFLNGEKQFYHYRESGSELILQGTLEIPIENFIQRNPVPFNQSETYWEANRNIIQGSIKEVFPLDSGIVILYAKGIPEEITQRYKQDDVEEREEMIQKHNPGYLAIFDKTHQLLTWDVLAPKGLIFTSIVNNKGEIIVLKDQEYYGLEDDFITFYRLRVNWSHN
jgi:hypothetical protein